MQKQLDDWISEKEKNGVKQHDEEWFQRRIYTIGGSSIAVIMGKNPYSSIQRIIGERIGMYKFIGNIKTQWGTLFEKVIKQYVEIDRRCEIRGEDLFIEGPPGTSYSPDGLTILENESASEIVLVEFKCPYSRIPSGSIPEYYIPQIKMGLDLLNLPTMGLFVEGVFRRCSWEDLGNNPRYDRTLVFKSSGKLPLAYSFIGFYFNQSKFDKYREELAKRSNEQEMESFDSLKKELWDKYSQQYKNTSVDEFVSNDIGTCPENLFTLIMDAFDKKIITQWYGKIKYVDINVPASNGRIIMDDLTKKMEKIKLGGVTAQYDETIILESMNKERSEYEDFCRIGGFKNFGILPWKLFRVYYKFIQKETDYIKPWLEKINEIIDVVKRCNDPANSAVKMRIYNSYFDIGMINASE